MKGASYGHLSVLVMLFLYHIRMSNQIRFLTFTFFQISRFITWLQEAEEESDDDDDDED